MRAALRCCRTARPTACRGPDRSLSRSGGRGKPQGPRNGALSHSPGGALPPRAHVARCSPCQGEGSGKADSLPRVNPAVQDIYPWWYRNSRVLLPAPSGEPAAGVPLATADSLGPRQASAFKASAAALSLPGEAHRPACRSGAAARITGPSSPAGGADEAGLSSAFPDARPAALLHTAHLDRSAVDGASGSVCTGWTARVIAGPRRVRRPSRAAATRKAPALAPSQAAPRVAPDQRRSLAVLSPVLRWLLPQGCHLPSAVDDCCQLSLFRAERTRDRARGARLRPVPAGFRTCGACGALRWLGACRRARETREHGHRRAVGCIRACCGDHCAAATQIHGRGAGAWPAGHTAPVCFASKVCHLTFKTGWLKPLRPKSPWRYCQL